MVGMGEGVREPSLRDTEFSITDPERRKRLELKLDEYKDRAVETGMKFVHPGALLIKYGTRGYLELFKLMVLEKALQIAAERDTAAEPINIMEMALIIQDETGLQVTKAAAVPYVYDQYYGVMRASHDYTDFGGSFEAYEFAQAYNIVQFYANGNEHMASGGTGLPQASS